MNLVTIRCFRDQRVVGRVVLHPEHNLWQPEHHLWTGPGPVLELRRFSIRGGMDRDGTDLEAPRYSDRARGAPSGDCYEIDVTVFPIAALYDYDRYIFWQPGTFRLVLLFECVRLHGQTIDPLELSWSDFVTAAHQARTGTSTVVVASARTDRETDAIFALRWPFETLVLHRTERL